MHILVLAEHDNKKLNAATLNTLSAAKQIGVKIDLLIAGFQCEPVVKSSENIGCLKKIIVADHHVYEHPLAENVSQLIHQLSSGYTHILTPSTTTGKNVFPRVAALLAVEQISDIVSVESACVFKRPLYAGNLIATVESSAPIHVITVRASSFESCERVENKDVIVEKIDLVFETDLAQYVSEQHVESERPELTAADIVISGGRGLGSKDNFELLYQLADKLGGAVGATRAAVDSGFADNNMQVGQTGKIVSPKLYIAIGISGAIQHLAGMKESKTIVAINKDENAPIFQVADYGLVADLFAVIPEMLEKIPQNG